MRMSELSSASGVPVPSIKFYLREGLLPAGERLKANQVSYTDGHARRLRLIRALIDIGGLSVNAARQVLAAVDAPDLPLSKRFGVAQYALSLAGTGGTAQDGPGRAAVDALVGELGWTVAPGNPGREAAARVLDAFADLGQPQLVDLAPDYARAAEAVARADLAAVAARADLAAMTETVVVGTVLGDTLLAALRRMAQEHIARGQFGRAAANSNDSAGRTS
jgi:DNA-binding transcriptional MerR regulator